MEKDHLSNINALKTKQAHKVDALTESVQKNLLSNSGKYVQAQYFRIDKSDIFYDFVVQANKKHNSMITEMMNERDQLRTELEHTSQKSFEKYKAVVTRNLHCRSKHIAHLQS